MRILYVDIDSLRPDHLGCYGYHRDTSPNLDRIAAQGVRYENCCTSDAPCLPSRTALFAGRAGIHTGVVNHGGAVAQPFIEGADRPFHDAFGQTSFISRLRDAGLHTVTISPFGERHAAWHWYAGFREIHNPGKGGGESAEEVSPIAIDWIQRNAKRDNWFLHLNFWDPHTAYRAPEEAGQPFKDEPIPGWLTEDVLRRHREGGGPHSAREVLGWDRVGDTSTPRQPVEIEDMSDVRAMFDGYDTGVWWADRHLGRLFDALEQQGVLDDTVICLSSDHGENLGELNIYGDHQTADAITCRIPMVLRWPGVTDSQAGRVDDGMIHHFDMAATILDMLGLDIPDNWDGRSFADTLRKAEPASVRDDLVVSQCAWAAARGVYFRAEGKRWILVRNYHDGYHGFPDRMLFNLDDDPHETLDLAPQRPDLVGDALTRLDRWLGDMMRTASHGHDPIWTVLHEGGSYHTRGELPRYLRRLRATGRDAFADRLEQQHPADAAGPDAPLETRWKRYF